MLIYDRVRDSKVNEIAQILYITNFDYSDIKKMILFARGVSRETKNDKKQNMVQFSFSD